MEGICMKYDDTSEESIIDYAGMLVGRTFGDIDKYGRLDLNKANKGDLGQIIEESHFEYKVNSVSEADFEHVGIELKVTPYKVNKNKTISAKERLVLNIINYMEEYQREFKTSSFWKKNEKMLLVFYEWQKDLPRSEYLIRDVMLNQFSDEDLFIIQKDWETIIDKIKLGIAHEISEADTNYLAACTKGSNKNSVRRQPFSDIPAMQRAFSLKASYMTALLRSRLGEKGEKAESLINNLELLKKKTLEEVIIDRFKPHYGKSQKELFTEYGLVYDEEKDKKNINNMIVRAILDLQNSEEEIVAEEFLKAGIRLKTVTLRNFKSKEHFKFCGIPSFEELIQEKWEDSTVHEFLNTIKFLLLVFNDENSKIKGTQKYEKKPEKVTLVGAKFWNMPISDVEGAVKRVWKTEVNKLRTGVELEYTPRRVNNNFIKPSKEDILHLRPDAGKAQYCGEYRDKSNKLMNNARKLPAPSKWTNRPENQKNKFTDDYMTKQAWWLSGDYIYEQIKTLF